MVTDVAGLAENQSECSHTPGPWFQLKPGSACIEAPSGNVAVTNLARASEADARLIAAAPDLLAAARAGLAVIMAYGDGNWGETEKLVRAAIAKAEGK